MLEELSSSFRTSQMLLSSRNSESSIAISETSSLVSSELSLTSLLSLISISSVDELDGIESNFCQETLSLFEKFSSLK
jgi:hypothetical protein